MKKIVFKTYMLTMLGFSILIFSSFCISAKTYKEKAEFLILVETTKDGIKLTSEKGCAWKELIVKVNPYVPRTIDQFGMVSPGSDSKIKDSTLSDFRFIIKKTNNSVVLDGLLGTAWTNLSFSCKNSMIRSSHASLCKSGNCAQYIDFSGMSSK